MHIIHENKGLVKIIIFKIHDHCTTTYTCQGLSNLDFFYSNTCITLLTFLTNQRIHVPVQGKALQHNFSCSVHFGTNAYKRNQ